MRLSEIKGEKALDVLADIIEPITEICADAEVAAAFRSGQTLKAIKPMIKNHKTAIIAILAALDCADPATYEVSIFALPMKIMDVLNDPEITQLFPSAETAGGAKSSGSALGNKEN